MRKKIKTGKEINEIITKEYNKQIGYVFAVHNVPKNVPDYLDISEDQDNSVLMWRDYNKNLVIFCKTEPKLNEDCSYMFEGMNINGINLKEFDTSKVQNAEGMFKNCTNLTKIIFNENSDFRNIENVSEMFMNCIKLRKINLSFLQDQKIASANRTFENCRKLKEINLSNFKGNYIKTADNCFHNTRNLEMLNIESFQGIMFETNMNKLAVKKTCEIKEKEQSCRDDEDMIMDGKELNELVRKELGRHAEHIKVVKSIPKKKVTYFDISKDKNKSIIMWRDGEDLCVYGKRKMKLGNVIGLIQGASLGASAERKIRKSLG